jgi:hypothetical protein
MPKIYKDEVGLYAKVGGWIARPTTPSNFIAGDITEGKHFGGSPIVGLGKIEGRDNYQEYWQTVDLHCNI